MPPAPIPTVAAPKLEDYMNLIRKELSEIIKDDNLIAEAPNPLAPTLHLLNFEY